MSNNCIKCGINKRTGLDLLCDSCRPKNDALSKRTELGGKPFMDMAGIGMPEDERITLIGQTVIKSGKRAALLVDDEIGKPGRYMSKLRKQFPELDIMDGGPGPTKGAYTIVVDIKRNTN
jgi:hypothetical protein